MHDFLDWGPPSFPQSKTTRFPQLGAACEPLFEDQIIVPQQDLEDGSILAKNVTLWFTFHYLFELSNGL